MRHVGQTVPNSQVPKGSSEGHVRPPLLQCLRMPCHRCFSHHLHARLRPSSPHSTLLCDLVAGGQHLGRGWLGVNTAQCINEDKETRLETEESLEEHEVCGEELRDGYNQNRDHKGKKGQWGGGRGAPPVGVVTYILLVPQRTWPLSPSHWCQTPRRRREESGRR